MNDLQRQEDNDAWFSRADRFDGFDRGDADLSWEDEQNAYAEADAREMGLI